MKRSDFLSGKLIGLGFFTVACLFPAVLQAQSDTDQIRRQLETLRQQVETLTQRLEEAEKNAAEAGTKAEQASHEVLSFDRAASKWHMSGYMDAGYTTTDTDEPTHFFAGHFNPAFHFQLYDNIFFESEVEFETDEDGATEIALEYAHMNIMLHDYVTLLVGKWLSPVGQFQERLHPSWINKMGNAPLGFAHGGIQPLSEVGMQVRGGIPVGDMIFTYAVGVGNGPQGGHHGVELEGFNSDKDGKSVSGRVAILPLPYLEIGGSFMFADVLGEEADLGRITSGDYELWGFDAAFTKDQWDVRFEYLDSELGSFWGREHHGDVMTSLIPESEWNAWYIQGAYRLSGISQSPIISRLEPVIRYGEFDTEGFFAEGDEDRFNIGLNYWFAPSAVGRVVVEWRDFEDPTEEDLTTLQIQFAYGF